VVVTPATSDDRRREISFKQQDRIRKAPIHTGPVFLRSLGDTGWRTGAARDVKMSCAETVGSGLKSNSSLSSSVDAEIQQ
jgi:hypothetical protein